MKFYVLTFKAMKIFLIGLAFLLSTDKTLAAFNEVLVIKQISEDGSQFVFVRKEGPAPWNGIAIKDPHTKALLYEAKVTKCGPKACAGVVVKNLSGLKLRKDEEYLHSYHETGLNFEPKESKAPEVKPPPPPPPEPPKPEVKPPPEPKKVPPKPSLMDQAIYFSYGSPVGPGLKLGYFKKVDSLWLGVNYSNVSSTTSQVMLKGHLLSGVGSYTVFKPMSNLDINLLGELGVLKATLDFQGVDADGPVEDQATYLLDAAAEGKLSFDRLSLVLKSGMSKSGLASTYNGTLNKYSNPYGTLLIFLEIGAYYRF